MNQSEVAALADTDPVAFVAYTIQGEWPFDRAGQFLCALCMALRIERWKHNINDLKREWFGWKQCKEPDEFARYLASRVLDGRLLRLMFCFSKDDVVEALPRMGYHPGPADLVYPNDEALYGLRLYCERETWEGKETP